MFALASPSGSGSRVFFASAPYTSASCRAFSTAPDSRSRPRARRTSASPLRRFRMSRSRSSTSIALPSFSAWIVTNVTFPSRTSVPGVREQAGDFRPRGHREGRLPLDDVQVLAPRDAGVVGVSLLADLPLGEGGADVRGDLDDVVVELPTDPEGLEREERHHRPDPLAAGLDHVARDVVEQRLFGDDALPDAGLDHREFFSHAKVERTHEPGRPIASYRLALYNHFRGTEPMHARERSADGVRHERIVAGAS